MDPLVQGLAGAAAALSLSKSDESKSRTAILGFLTGLAADLDVLITSREDPLLFLEFHRHFTHSLLFIPVGALLAAVILLLPYRSSFSFKRLYLLCFAAYATHGIIDACTSYGTQLLWPFSSCRSAWNVVAIVDPAVTLLLFIGAFRAIKLSSRTPAIFSVLFVTLYMILGFIQGERVKQFMHAVSEARGHQREKITVKPTPMNNFLFKSIYYHDSRYYVDGVRVGLFSKSLLYPGESVRSLTLSEALDGVPPESTLDKDIKRFNWFSDGYIFIPDNEKNLIGDLRYSLLPDEIDPLWGIMIRKEAPELHVQFINTRKITPERKRRFIAMLLGNPVR